VVLAVAFLASLVSTYLYSIIRSPAPVAKSQTVPSLSFTSFLKGARKEHLGTFILFAALFGFVVNLSGPLLAVHMITDLKFSFITYTLIVSCEFVARVISITFWGKMVDKSGSLRVLGIASHLIPLSPFLWLFSGNIGYLCVVQLFSGTVWAAYDLSVQTFIYKSTQPEQRLHYIVYHRSLTTFAAALGTLTSAFLLNNMFHVFGSQILGMCLLSAILRLAVVRLMLPKLKPGGIPDAIVHEELARELAMVNYPTRQGLYYHPEVWSRFSKPVSAFGTMLGKAVNKLSPRPAGLYYNPQQWSNYMGQNSDLQPGMVQSSSSETEKSGLYHDKKAWAEYMQQTAVQMEPNTEHAREGLLYNPEARAAAMNQILQAEGKAASAVKQVHKGLLYDPEAWALLVNQMAQANAKFSESLKPVRKGLLYDPEALAKFVKQTAVAEAREIDSAKTTRTGIFYDSQKWSDYLKQSMVLNATTMRTAGDGQANRQPIFYHPEIWNNYKNQAALSKVVNVKTNTKVMSARQPLLYHPEEWDRTFDPAMVHIGRKSSIGTVINKQSQVKKIERKLPSTNYHPAAKPTMISKRIGTRPSMA
jgi:MFS family permease